MLNISQSVLYLLRERGPLTADEMCSMINTDLKLKRTFSLNVGQVYAAMSTLRSKRHNARNLIRPVNGYVGRGQKYELTPCGVQKAERIMPVAPDRSAPLQGSGVDRRQAERREMVNHPQHYGGDTTYETVKVLEAWQTPEAFRGGLRFNSVKYLSRAGKKGNELEDLRKARWYLDKEIALLEKEKGR
jgi:hypothetical protein